MFTSNRALILLPSTAITTAVSAGLSTPLTGLIGLSILSAQAVFTYGSGGTSAKFYLQTTLDSGATWFDIACWAFATTTATRIQSVRAMTAVAANVTPVSKALADNTILDGLLGDQLRIAYTTVGTYATTSIVITASARGLNR